VIPNIQPARYETNVSNIQHAFTIEMTPTLAKLLSSQTYTDKILAAIREPLSNAYDSHVRAGTLDTPVRLHLPTALEPHFSIRDFGTGLSHDDVIRLFFSYGVSDKRDTNNEIGGLGIGAKAFFAYTDQAVISSWFNGQKRTYSANKGPNGLPQGMLVSIEETDEPNGIELSYPVSAGEYFEFESKAVQILTYLKLNFECNKSLTIPDPAVLYSLTVDKYQVDILSGTDKPLVVMGGIAYTIPVDIWVHRCRESYNFVMRESFILHLPIGSVEISASRESLSPTEQDKAFIAEVLFKTRELLKATDWDATIAKANSWREAVEIRNNLGGFMHFEEYIVDGKKVPAEEVMKWRGFKTRGHFTLPDGSHPVMMVERKGRRGNVYASHIVNGHRIGSPIVAAYWMPSNKRIGWKDWYKENVDLSYYSNDRHLHFVTETMAEAEALAKVYGYDGVIRDGSQCRVPRANRKPVSPRPTGVVLVISWYTVTKVELKDIANPNEELIYIEGSKNGHVDLHVLRELTDAGIIKAKKLLVIDRFNMPKEKAEKQFSGMARSVKEWMAKYPELVDQEKLKANAIGAEISRYWHKDWCHLFTLRTEGHRFKFKLDNAEFKLGSTLLQDYVVPPSVTKQLKAIQKWHDTQLPKLPPTIQKHLKRNDYVSANSLFQLYEEMK
jgi:hypothetical protein